MYDFSIDKRAKITQMTGLRADSHMHGRVTLHAPSLIVRGPALKRAQNQGRCSDFNSRTFLFLETVASNLLSTIFHVGIFAFGRLQQERTKSVALSNGRRRLSR